MTGKFITAPLNISSLDRSNWVDTEWVIITGAPSAGKTTVLKNLTSLGYICTSEVAREIVENKKVEQGDKIYVRNDEVSFQRVVTNAKLTLEASLDPNQIVFLDRGMPDSITYYRATGIDPNEAAEHCLRFKYKKIFLLERLPLVEDGIRIEDDALAQKIQEWLVQDYQSLRYEIIRVPVAPTTERVETILSHLR